MRVVFYTRSGYLDAALALLGPLSEVAEVHLVLESSPEGAEGPLGRQPEQDRPGVHAGDLAWLPQPWRAPVASFHFAVFDRARAFHPANALTCRGIASLIRRVRADVVHFDEASTRSVSTLLFARRVPLVLGIHDSHPRIGESGGRFELVRRRFLKRARVVLFHSDYARRAFCERVEMPRGAQVRVVPLGIYDPFAALCSTGRDDGKSVLFFGRVAEYKGVDVLRAAAPLVAESVPDVRFVVAGRPVPGYRLDDLPSLPNGGTWELLDRHVGMEEACALFRGATVVVLPYLEASQSGVVSTAFAFDKPVVATAVGGIPEIVEDGVTGRLVAPRDPGALAEAIAEVVGDGPARERLRAGVRAARAGALGWPALAEATLDAYRAAAS